MYYWLICNNNTGMNVLPDMYSQQWNFIIHELLE